MAEVKEKKKLGVAEMAAYGIGNCIGSGIFVSMGVGIGYTGKSIPLALIIANIVVFFAYFYKSLMAGMFTIPGGRYSQTALIQPPILVGFSAISLIFSGLAFAMYGLSVVDYAATVFPQIEPYRNLIAVAIITLFFATTLLGGKFMGKFNMIMVVVLVISLIVYIAVGLPEVNLEAVRPTSDGYFKGGFMGLFMAIAVMSFACQGSTMPIDMTSDAKNPKKTLPKAIIVSSLVVLIVYTLIGIVSVGVVPVENVADKNLGVVAKEIFPYPVFVVFIIGGACFAIATSLYSTIAGIRYPLMAAVNDGWLPAFLGKKTKKDYPYVIMLLLYIIAIVSIFVDFGLQELISIMMIPTMILNTINNILVLRPIKNYPHAWKTSFFRMPKWALYIAVAVSTLCSLFITACLFTTLSVRDRILIVIVVIFIFAYSFYRLKAEKVDLHEIEAAKAEAEKAAEIDEGK